MGKREAHIRELCEQLGVTLVFTRRAAQMYVPKLGRTVDYDGSASTMDVHLTAPAWDAIAYFVALHELGHIHHSHPRFNSHYWDDIPEGEGEAWEWALDHAREAPSPAVIDWIANVALHSYHVGIFGPRPAGPTCQRVLARVGAVR